jgi:hypothetical protein
VGIFHPSREHPNDHRAVFAEYAQSAHWTAIHLGQFVGMALIIAGLLALFVALNVDAGLSAWAMRFGAVSASVALALYGILQAVDGVALKQAVDAWFTAPDAEQAARFASAETMRWLEWGVRSYYSFLLGVALMLFGTAGLTPFWWTDRLGGLPSLLVMRFEVDRAKVAQCGMASAPVVPAFDVLEDG